MKKTDFNVVFMGTPDFAVASLDKLVTNGYNIVAVVTAADKPAGRGRKLQVSPVKQKAIEHGIPVLQPVNLKDEAFLAELQAYQPDLFMVVAFRMLPEVVWKMPSHGTVNLHASLLPQYRGAAPINWVLINGEQETGVSTFFIEKNIDTGHLIDRRKVEIGPAETAGELHDKLMHAGANLVFDTVGQILQGRVKTIPQSEFTREGEELKPAPKIFKEDCKINWEWPAEKVYNFIRGVSPYPAAWTELHGQGRTVPCKIYKATKNQGLNLPSPGSIETDGENFLRVSCLDGFIEIEHIQQSGKKRMGTREFLRGFKDIGAYTAG